MQVLLHHHICKVIVCVLCSKAERPKNGHRSHIKDIGCIKILITMRMRIMEFAIRDLSSFIGTTKDLTCLVRMKAEKIKNGNYLTVWTIRWSCLIYIKIQNIGRS